MYIEGIGIRTPREIANGRPSRFIGWEYSSGWSIYSILGIDDPRESSNTDLMEESRHRELKNGLMKPRALHFRHPTSMDQLFAVACACSCRKARGLNLNLDQVFWLHSTRTLKEVIFFV